MSYSIESRPASKNGWLTPAESNVYYKLRYDRSTVACHWWGDGTGADNHDNIVNYMNGQAAQGIKSTNYVLSDNKITECVSPDNVAWCTGPTANAISISIEFQPTLGAEGYKKAGWLVAQLEARYGRILALRGHREFAATACPGTIDINRIRAEADRWKSGFYNAPAPRPAPQPNPQGAIEMINNADEAVLQYKQLRPNYNPTQDELNITVGKRSHQQFLRDGIREREQRDAALAAQSQALQNAQNQVNELNAAIQSIRQLQANTDTDLAAKNAELTRLGGIVEDKSKALDSALAEVQRLNGIVCKVPEKEVPEAFSWIEKLLAKLLKKPSA